MIKFLHISDLHFHKSDKKNAKILKTLSNIEKRCPKHKIILTGDITDDGDKKQYSNAIKALEPFKGRLFVAPGNHDYGKSGNFYHINCEKHFNTMFVKKLGLEGFSNNTPVVSIIEEKFNVAVIALDTNLRTEHPFDFACGEVGTKQLRALDSILKRKTLENHIKILIFHHHPFMFNNPFMELKDAKKLWKIIYNRVDVVAFGHKHESSMWKNYGGVPFVLSSDDTPGKKYAREIKIQDSKISVKNVRI